MEPREDRLSIWWSDGLGRWLEEQVVSVGMELSQRELGYVWEHVSGRRCLVESLW